MIVAALRGALSDRARNGRVFIIDQFALGEQPSTKAAAAFLAQVATSKNILVVLDRSDELSYKSLRNLQTVHVLAVDQLNAYDVLHADDIVFTASAMTQYVEAATRTEEVSA
jgi:large subunit ribosomal protein L4